MIVLTDCPLALRPLVMSSVRMAAGDLPAEQAAAWRALSNDSELFRAEVPGPLPVLLVIEQADQSQFSALLRALSSGVALPHGLATLALEGREFKGQRERSWQAVRGNLHLCVYDHLDRDAAEVGMGLTVLPAIATAAAIRNVSAGAIMPGIKWVNDVLVNGRKVSGVLTATQASGTRIEHVVFGVGLNVERAPVIAPTPFVPASGCLGNGLSWQETLVPLLEEMDRRYRELVTHGPSSLIEAYRSDAIVLNRRVRIWPDGTTDLARTPPSADGVVTAIDDDLALRIDSCPEPVRSGRLALVS